MNRIRVFITGMGVMSPLGNGVPDLYASLKKNCTGIKPLSLFPASAGNLLPAGEIAGFQQTDDVPRTHGIALAAAREALAGREIIPDAIIIGTTTGGMPRTEELLKKRETEADLYRYHSTSSVAEYIADVLRCTGLVITVTTACSSGTAAVKLALELLRSGRAGRVLAGGADALCRLTYYGFNSLQLIDPAGARPLDRTRRGMTVAEGSAMLLLEAAESAPAAAIAEVLGGGLSCDAHHPASPHPEGEGALNAMRRAIEDAGITPAEIDYINLHGTGTLDNDLSEARAVAALFGEHVPLLSSVKGATGHSLAAAGAIEAVICSLAVRDGLIPANTGCAEPDPALNLRPVMAPMTKKSAAVLSNSFGFGGNNACLVLGDPGKKRPAKPRSQAFRFEITGSACMTGAGDMGMTLNSLEQGRDCRGTLPLADISKNLPAREVRRLKRLPRLALALAMEAAGSSDQKPSSIFFSTSWGPLSETHDLLTKLFESEEQFTSPTDFVGSVHNAPAGQAAIWLQASGANITVTGGDYSFEQALFAAAIAAGEENLLIIGADEHHEILSPLFDGSARIGRAPSDGGGALCLKRATGSSRVLLSPLFFERSVNNSGAMKSLMRSLGGPERVRSSYAAIFAGMPAAHDAECKRQLSEFISAAGFSGPVVDFRKLLGEFGSATSAAASIAARFAQDGALPPALAGGSACPLAGKGILMLGLGACITAIEIRA